MCRRMGMNFPQIQAFPSHVFVMLRYYNSFEFSNLLTLQICSTGKEGHGIFGILLQEWCKDPGYDERVTLRSSRKFLSGI